MSEPTCCPSHRAEFRRTKGEQATVARRLAAAEQRAPDTRAVRRLRDALAECAEDLATHRRCSG